MTLDDIQYWLSATQEFLDIASSAASGGTL